MTIHSLITRGKKFLVDGRWGASSMVALYLSLISGVVVALQYDPAHPYYSVSSLDILAPFGLFWRSLHFYASQLFFLLAIVHLLAVIVGRTYESLTFKRWLPLALSMVAALLLLFTGYILRGDATGSSAGMIAENILLTIPWVGRLFDSLLFSLLDEGMKRVYANHLIGLGLLWLVLCWDHIRRYRTSWRQEPLLVLALIGFSALVPAPIEPERIGVFHINGPWFFIGLQELLRYIQPFWAGIVWPSTLVVALVLIYKEKMAARARLYCLGWAVVYIALTLVGLSR
jgi:quinol-cytochrome oxidoreductase complex cytochrome b subunit